MLPTCRCEVDFFPHDVCQEDSVGVEQGGKQNLRVCEPGVPPSALFCLILPSLSRTVHVRSPEKLMTTNQIAMTAHPDFATWTSNAGSTNPMFGPSRARAPWFMRGGVGMTNPNPPCKSGTLTPKGCGKPCTFCFQVSDGALDVPKCSTGGDSSGLNDINCGLGLNAAHCGGGQLDRLTTPPLPLLARSTRAVPQNPNSFFPALSFSSLQ